MLTFTVDTAFTLARSVNTISHFNIKCPHQLTQLETYIQRPFTQWSRGMGDILRANAQALKF